MSSQKCQKGQIERVAYTAHRNNKQVNIAATCVKDMGLPGKTPEANKIDADLERHDLSAHGYKNIRTLKAEDRHTALAKAINSYGAIPVLRKVNLLMILQRNTSPSISKLFERDRNWIHRNYVSDPAKSTKK